MNSQENGQAQSRDIIARLQNAIKELPELLALLTAPLDSIGLLPPQFVRYNTTPLPDGAFKVSKHIPALQRALLEHVIPTWEALLTEKRMYGIVEQYFCPDLFSFASPAAGELAIHGYSTILSLPLTEYSVRFLVRLSKAYPIDVLWTVVFGGLSGTSERKEFTWEDCVRNVIAIPGKVANALGGKSAIPPELEYGLYFNHVSRRCETLIQRLSMKRSKGDVISVNYILTKLVNVGVFPVTVPTSPSQPSFFQSTLPSIRSNLTSPSYASIWPEIITATPSTFTLQTVIASLFTHIKKVEGLDALASARTVAKEEALLLSGILGRMTKDSDDLWDTMNAVLLGREWTVGHARIFVCWVAGCERNQFDVEALETLLGNVVDLWTNADHIRHSLLNKHHSLLLLTISYISAPGVSSAAIKNLAFSPLFIKSISTYLTHLDPSVRRCGMMIAEEVARGAGKKLDFADWDGENDGKAWCKAIRVLTKERDIDAEIVEDSGNEAGEGAKNVNIREQPAPPSIPSQGNLPKVTKPQDRTALVQDVTEYDSDDSLTGYITSPSSSRSPSPTPSELEEIEKDPTLRVTQKKIARPVYLAQLGDMIRPAGGLKPEAEEDEAQKQQVALDVAEEQIRRKRSYGTELEENAVNLVYGLIGLQDSYELEGFSQKRQAALNALVACCPRKAALAMIEEFFKNQYSAEQRYAILNALALGARELASLPIPETPAMQTPERISFTSKRLPPMLHHKYLTAADQQLVAAPVQNLLEGISREAIDKGRDAAAEKVPAYVRERQLRIKKPARITEVTKDGTVTRPQSSQMMARPATVFTDVAAEYFICPLINRFWLFLRDEQTREARTAQQPTLHQYKGSGTGLILNALVLSHFMATLAVLVHAARHAKEWLAIVAPDALELAVTVGTRPLSSGEGEDEDADDNLPGGQASAKGKEAALLTTSLELALVVLDGCVDLDGGRTMSLEHTALVLGVSEWAEEVLSRLEKGIKMLGGGGVQEMKLRRAAAGVVLKADEVTSRWKRSMIDVLSNA
ncbi:unnamed protein product [Somion occarium]|uniref:Telomere length regulation protein conserved domain-containing protein n=1 Tax=Somion occarium TaxID=3059160 RepID=A0ABP1D874_9APHY